MLIILGFLAMVAMYVFVGVFTAAGIALFVDLPSAIFILVPLIFFLFATKSGKIISRYIAASFTKNYVYTEAELARISGAVKNIIKFILGLGPFGFMTGIMASLMHLDTVEYLGPNVAISLMTIMYSITLAFFVFFPVQAWADNKINLLPD